MPPGEYLMDACALLALFNLEEGWKVVQNLIIRAKRKKIRLRISIVNLVEVYYDLIREAGPERTQEVFKRVARLPITVIDRISPEVAREAARLKSEAGMSLADTFLVATALCTGTTVVTCDHTELDPIDEQGIVPFYWIRPRPEKR